MGFRAEAKPVVMRCCANGRMKFLPFRYRDSTLDRACVVQVREEQAWLLQGESLLLYRVDGEELVLDKKLGFVNAHCVARQDYCYFVARELDQEIFFSPDWRLPPILAGPTRAVYLHHEGAALWFARGCDYVHGEGRWSFPGERLAVLWPYLIVVEARQRPRLLVWAAGGFQYSARDYPLSLSSCLRRQAEGVFLHDARRPGWGEGLLLDDDFMLEAGRSFAENEKKLRG